MRKAERSEDALAGTRGASKCRLARQQHVIPPSPAGPESDLTAPWIT
jgi:hypothetical protein